MSKTIMLKIKILLWDIFILIHADAQVFMYATTIKYHITCGNFQEPIWVQNTVLMLMMSTYT